MSSPEPRAYLTFDEYRAAFEAWYARQVWCVVGTHRIDGTYVAVAQGHACAAHYLR